MKSKTEQSEYLEMCLRSYYMAHRKEHQTFYREKRDQVIATLQDNFQGMLADKIIMSGSLKKSTELNTNFDVDLIVPFRHDAFTLDNMAAQVYEVLEDSFAHKLRWVVRDQRVSVGMIYKKFGGPSVKIDVVPGREIGLNAYRWNRYLKLYSSDGQTHFQTNIHLQVEALQNAPKGTRRIIRLLKIWKNHGNGLKIKSFFLELLAIEAMKYQPAYQPELVDQLLHTLAFIRDNIQSIRLIDPGNSNNIVSEMLTAMDKRKISKTFESMIASIQSRPNALLQFFPPNSEFYEG